MKVTLTDNNLNELIAEHSFFNSIQMDQGIVNQQFHVDYRTTGASVRLLHFDEVLITSGKYTSEDKLLVKGTYDENFDGIEMHFNLKGRSTGRMLGERNFVSIEQNEHNLMYYPRSEGEFLIEPNANIEIAEVSFSSIFFKRFANCNDPVIDAILEAKEKNQPCRIPQNGKINSTIYQCLFDIFNHDDSSNLKHLYLESKITELLIHQLNSFKTNSTFLLESELMVYAGDYLKLHMDTPPTTKELAAILGTNEFKLKQSFKAYHGYSVYEYVIKLRMDYARRLLLDTQLSILDITHKIGYSNQQYFSTAFKKEYAITPGQLRRNGKAKKANILS